VRITYPSPILPLSFLTAFTNDIASFLNVSSRFISVSLSSSSGHRRLLQSSSFNLVVVILGNISSALPPDDTAVTDPSSFASQAAQMLAQQISGGTFVAMSSGATVPPQPITVTPLSPNGLPLVSSSSSSSGLAGVYSSGSDGGLSGGAIAGIAVVLAVGVLIAMGSYVGVMTNWRFCGKQQDGRVMARELVDGLQAQSRVREKAQAVDGQWTMVQVKEN
jgi:hypothetical protein